MSLTALVLLASLAGAALFFAGGFLIGRGRRELAVAAAPEVVSGAGQAWSESVQAQLEALTKERDDTARRRDEVEAEVQRLSGTASQALQALEQGRARVASLERELATRATADASLESARGAASEAQARARASELAEARRQVSELTSKLEQRSSGAELQQRELIRLRGDLERACDEIATLRLEKMRAEKAEAGRAAVEAELARLKSLQFAATRPGSAPLKSLELAAGAPASSASLDDLVKRVQVQGRYESVAIADELGLTAAGVGPHTDELAAFTSLMLGVSARASRFFPMHELGHATITDAHGVSIEARPVAGPQGFVLMTLGTRQEQERS